MPDGIGSISEETTPQGHARGGMGPGVDGGRRSKQISERTVVDRTGMSTAPWNGKGKTE